MRKSCTHHQSKFCALAVSSLRPTPLGLLCMSCALHVRALGLPARALPPGGAVAAAGSAALPAGSLGLPPPQGSSVTHLPCWTSLPPLLLPSVLCCWPLWWPHARALVLLSPFCSAPALVSSGHGRTLPSLLAEKVNSSTPLSTTLPPDTSKHTDPGS